MSYVSVGDLLRQFTKKGWRTSEFWMTVVAIALMPVMDEGMEHLTTHSSDYAPWAQIAVAALVGAYNVARGIVKAAGLRALIQRTPIAVAPPTDDITSERVP